MDELVIDNLVYIPSKRAAAVTGYAKDYIGQLCREGRIEAKLVGRSWYVLESSIREHRFGLSAQATEAAPQDHVGVPESIAEHVQAEIEQKDGEEISLSSVHSWESPVYVAETPQNLIEEHPTSLENKPLEKEPVYDASNQIQEVQSAWQEWFARNNQARVAEPIEEASADSPAFERGQDKSEADFAEDVKEEVEEVVPEVPVPVRVHRSHPGSMDIGSVVVPTERTALRGRQGRRVSAPLRRAHAPQGARLVIQALCIGLIVVTIAITVIGTGSLDTFNHSSASSPGAVNFLAGVRIVEK